VSSVDSHTSRRSRPSWTWCLPARTTPPAGQAAIASRGLPGKHASARHATEEPVSPRIRHRLPWLLIGLAGAIAAAGVVGLFESELEEQVLLAFFVPGIVYMADAVGTQTEALVIRGLSVGVSIRRIMQREFVTGVLVGVTAIHEQLRTAAT
jgi:Mg/Co/Ni transporter MgtE